MDEAAVSTIHGWCNRMLREHAFDSDSLFTQTLETDQSELLAEVVRDYWRTFMVPLDIEAVAEVRPWWSRPGDATRRPAGSGRSRRPARGCTGAGPGGRGCLRGEATSSGRAQGALGDLGRRVAGTCSMGPSPRNRSNGRKLQAQYYTPWLQTLRAWAADPPAGRPRSEERLEAPNPRRVWPDAWNQGDPPTHPALDAIVTLQADLDDLPDARSAILRHAARWVAARFATEQDRRAQMGFNDLLSRLDAALDGPNGERLAEIIRRQFPVALIDEFQDTDPVQYRIFDAVYRVAANDPGDRARPHRRPQAGDLCLPRSGYLHLSRRHAGTAPAVSTP